MAKDDTANAEEDVKKTNADADTIVPDEETDDSKETTTEKPTGDSKEETKDKKETKPEGSEAPDTEDKAKAREGYLSRIRQKDNQETKLEAEKQQAIAQIEDETQKRLQAIEWDAYISKVTQARERLVSDEERVRSTIPIFNPESSDYNKAVHERALARYARDGLIANDANEIVGYRVPLFDYLKEEADLYLAGSQTGVKKRDKAKATMDANAEGAGVANRGAEGNDDEDPFLKGFNSYGK